MKQIAGPKTRRAGGPMHSHACMIYFSGGTPRCTVDVIDAWHAACMHDGAMFDPTSRRWVSYEDTRGHAAKRLEY